MKERFFHVEDIEGDGAFHIPIAFFIHSEYKNLSSFAKITWAILADLLVDAYQNGWICEKSRRIYLLEPERYVERLFQNEKLYDYSNVIEELIKHQLLVVEHVQEGNRNRYFLKMPKQSNHERNLSHLLKMKRQYVKNAMQNDEGNHIKRRTEKEKQAMTIVESYFEYADLKQLTDDNKLVLYENLDKIEWLRKHNLFSLSLIITLKTKYSLSTENLSMLLQKAFSLYRYDENNRIHFTSFFEQVIKNQAFLNNKEKLIWEIDQKLVDIPNELKKFVYNEMRKYEHKFPKRYEQILSNMRHINTIYQDFPDLPDEVFQKAFRRLFTDYEIHHLGTFFKKGIQLVLNERNKNEKNEVEETTNESNWLEQLFSNVAQEGEQEVNRDFEKRKEALSQKLKNLTNPE